MSSVSLSRDGFEAYISCTAISLNVGIIDRGEVSRRLRCLQSLLSADLARPRVNALAQIFAISEEQLEPFREYRWDEHDVRPSGASGTEGEEATGRCSRPGIDRIALVPNQATGLQDWHFIMSDPDPHPSVPHGHLRTNHNRKLDAYLGWMVDDKGAVKGRVSREQIIALWNDDTFRQFAQKILGWFVFTWPEHNFRVPDPHKLPLKR